MPSATEAVVVIGYAKGQADSTVGGNHFEEDAEDAEAGGLGVEAVSFNYADQEEGEQQPPDVVG